MRNDVTSGVIKGKTETLMKILEPCDGLTMIEAIMHLSSAMMQVGINAGMGPRNLKDLFAQIVDGVARAQGVDPEMKAGPEVVIAGVKTASAGEELDDALLERVRAESAELAAKIEAEMNADPEAGLEKFQALVRKEFGDAAERLLGSGSGSERAPSERTPSPADDPFLRAALRALNHSKLTH